VVGASGHKVLRAIVAGERDGRVLGAMKNVRMRASLVEIARSMQVTAPAHKLVRLIYTLLTQGEEYTHQGQDYFEERYRERVIRQITQPASKLGLSVVPTAQAA
jgi:hypothetical protein